MSNEEHNLLKEWASLPGEVRADVYRSLYAGKDKVNDLYVKDCANVGIEVADRVRNIMMKGFDLVLTMLKEGDPWYKK